MKRKIKHLGMLALAMGIFTGSSLMYGNETEVQAAVQGVVGISQLNAPSLDTPIFNNDIDTMYYKVFGKRFDLMKQASDEVNKSAYYNGIRMEVLSTITIENTEYDYSYHTSYTFFTLQDVENNNRITNTTFLDLQDEMVEDNTFITRGSANSINYNEETQTMTFIAIYDHYDAEATNYLEHFPIKIKNILDGYTNDSLVIENVNILNLTNSHNPSFVNNNIMGNAIYHQHEELELELDFEELFKADTLKKNELNVPIDGWDSAYISNIAVKDNMLHIQTNTPVRSHGITETWQQLELIDTRTGNVSRPIYSIYLDNTDENFNNIDDREYEDFVFIIEDINNLNNYSLILDRYYYDTIIDTNLEISFSSPVIKDSYKTGKETEIVINNQNAKVSDINVSLMGLNLTIDTIEVLEEDISDIWEFIDNNLDIILVYNNGGQQVYSINDTEKIYSNNMASWSNEGESRITNINLGLSSVVIDIDNLEAININGTVIEVN